MSNPPISFASVFRMPIFFRLLRETTRIERVSSYSIGSPRSKNGMTTSSSPEVNATPRKISADSCRACVGGHDPPRLDPEPLLGVARLVRVELGRNQVQADPVPAPGRVFAEQVDQVGLGLDELAGHLGAVVRLDIDRPVLGDLLDQGDRLGRQRVQLLGGHVVPGTESCSTRTLQAARASRSETNRTSEWHPVFQAGLAARPVPPAQEHHVEIEHSDGQRTK